MTKRKSQRQDTTVPPITGSVEDAVRASELRSHGDPAWEGHSHVPLQRDVATLYDSTIRLDLYAIERHNDVAS